MLVGCELLANAACWVVTGILIGGRKDTQPILSLGLLAWVCVLHVRDLRTINSPLFPPFEDNRTEAWYVLDQARVPSMKGLIVAMPLCVALDADHIR